MPTLYKLNELEKSRRDIFSSDFFAAVAVVIKFPIGDLVLTTKNCILLQLGSEILALLCSDHPIEILVILSLFSTVKTETKLEGFAWSH